MVLSMRAKQTGYSCSSLKNPLLNDSFCSHTFHVKTTFARINMIIFIHRMQSNAEKNLKNPTPCKKNF